MFVFFYGQPTTLPLDKLGMAKAFKTVQVSNVAALVRMAMRTATTFNMMKQALDNAMEGGDVPLLSLASKEFDFYDTPAIINTLQRALDHAFLPDISARTWNMVSRKIQLLAGEQSIQKMAYDFLLDSSSSFTPSD